MTIWGHELSELFWRGGFVMWPLLLCSILALAVSLERIVVLLYRSPRFDYFSQQLRRLVLNRELDQARELVANASSPIAQVAGRYLSRLDGSKESREETVSREASEQLAVLEKRMNILAVIGRLTPMLGLLGTVAGLIDCFHNIEVLQGQLQPSDLASGIWKALLTTVFGLTVALPT
ncbi:MAG: MotA/TolQ/ExbB proton channel family protein, partial [Planctomycetales bacterium]